MKPTLCSRCKKRPAVVFITKMEGDKSTPEGLCLKCARELNIGPVTDMLNKMNISDEDLDSMTEEMMNMFGIDPENPDSDGEDGFELGGAATFPGMMNQFFGGNANPESQEEQEVSKEADGKRKDKKKNQKKRKYLNLYCTDLTGKARSGELDRIIGRDRELYRVIQILSRRTKNNPCLIGEPGVGENRHCRGTCP